MKDTRQITKSIAKGITIAIVFSYYVFVAVRVWNALASQQQESAKLAAFEEDRRLQEEAILRYSSIPPCGYNSDHICDDGDPCTNDFCHRDRYADATYSCQSRFLSETPDFRPASTCVINLCDRKTGRNISMPLYDGVKCSLRNSKHLGGQCKDGVCIPDTVLVCNDSNPCTHDIEGRYGGCRTQDVLDGSNCGRNGACYHGVCHEIGQIMDIH